MKKYKVKGMDCASCATLIQMDVEDLGYKCSCSYTTETLEIESDHDIKKVTEIIIKSGYTIEVT